MPPLRFRIDRIVDFGAVVCLIGVDADTTEPVTVHVDHRPFAIVQAAWRDAGLRRSSEYTAERLILHLDMRPAEEIGGVRLIEADVAAATSDEPISSAVEIEP